MLFQPVCNSNEAEPEWQVTMKLQPQFEVHTRAKLCALAHCLKQVEASPNLLQ